MPFQRLNKHLLAKLRPVDCILVTVWANPPHSIYLFCAYLYPETSARFRETCLSNDSTAVNAAPIGAIRIGHLSTGRNVGHEDHCARVTQLRHTMPGGWGHRHKAGPMARWADCNIAGRVIDFYRPRHCPVSLLAFTLKSLLPFNSIRQIRSSWSDTEGLPYPCPPACLPLRGGLHQHC